MSKDELTGYAKLISQVIARDALLLILLVFVYLATQMETDQMRLLCAGLGGLFYLLRSYLKVKRDKE